MGKGDKKSKRGKLFKGSYGVRRRKNPVKSVSVILPSDGKPKVAKEVNEVKEVKQVKVPKEVKEVKPVKETKAAKVTAPVKAPKTNTAARKEDKPKKKEAAE
jgi:ribosomal small subunit protein bTHX